MLADTCDRRFAVELNRFNLECNTLPVALAGKPLSSLGKQLDEYLARLRAIAGTHDARIALTGILPTLTAEDLESSAMTNLPRYRALSASTACGVNPSTCASTARTRSTSTCPFEKKGRSQFPRRRWLLNTLAS